MNLSLTNRVAGLVAITGLLSLSAFSDEPIYGTLTVVKGNVQVIDGKTHLPHVARAGARVFPGDSIVTGKDSRAKVTMVDSNVLNLSPDTKMEIQKYEYKPAENKKNVILSVDYGKLRSTVSQHYDGDENVYRVNTPSAVAGVRGTDFLVSYDKVSQSSQVVTFRGQVEVGGGIDVTGRITTPVRVNPGQATSSAPGSAPSTPVVLPPQQYNNLNQSSGEGTGSSSNSSSASATTMAKAAPTPGERAPASALILAPTAADLTNSAPTDVGRVPAALSPLMMQQPVAPSPIMPALVNPDIVKGGSGNLTVIVH